jgi:hypothetical protein
MTMMNATTLDRGMTARDDGGTGAGTSGQARGYTQERSAGFAHGDDAVVDKLYQLYGRSTERERATATSGSAARWGVALVEAAIGFEWLLSGLNKILNGHFTAGLAATLHKAMTNNPNGWWVTLTQHLVVPNLQLFGPLVPIGELLIALGFFTGAIRWLTVGSTRRRTPFVTFGVIGALLASVLMTTNFYLMAGNTLPGLNPSNAFNEGLSIDGLLTLIGAGLICAHASSLRIHSGASRDASHTDTHSLERAA